MEDDVDVTADDQSPDYGEAESKGPRQPDEAERKLVEKITKRVREDRAHHAKAFKVMRRDMKIARRGAPDDWPANNYVANITGRHINQKTAALYAKNPKAIARRVDKLDFQVWDENEQTLMMALQSVQNGMAMGTDPMTGQPVAAMMDPMFQQSMQIVQDYQQGMQARQVADKIGRTLEILFSHYTREQSPLDFKTSMKQLVRRASTCGVGYVKLGFQRELEQDPQITSRLSDFQAQLRHIERLAEEVMDESEESKEERETQARELELAMQSLQSQEYVLIREGLIFDFPDSTRVIPDKMTRHLTGFVGSRWVTVEHLYTTDEVEELFGVDLGKDYTAYSEDGSSRESYEPELDLSGGSYEDEARKKDLVCIWEHYDRAAGLVYIVCDGYKAFLREPGAPDVYVEDFWPVYALTFNEVEDPECLFPPSDVSLVLDMQNEYNRARQGKREHRQAARPRFASPKGALDDETKVALAAAKPFDVIEFNPASDDPDIRKLIQPIPVPGVDPNLYDNNETMTDIQLVVGAQEASFGAVAKATATESSIAESSRVASVDSNVDDLDAFLTRVARASGQILLKELSPETVTKIAGPGAVWPQVTLDQIAEEIFLEIEAGSSGKPNQAQEIRNWKEMLPFLIQMPNIQPTWLARETLRRLDDRMDLTEAVTENIPAIVAMNRMAGAAPPPGAMPEDQGGAGADNAEAPPAGPAGTDAPGGNNQQSVM